MNGNQERLQLLCDQYDYVMRLLRVMGVEESDVEDLTEEVFLTAYRKLHTLRDEKAMKAWVRTIANNIGKKYFKKINRRKKVLSYANEEENPIDFDDIAADEDTVERIMQKAEDAKMVRIVLGKLGALERNIIYMRFWGEYQFPEIAEIQNLNLNTVKSIYRRSLQKMNREYRALFGEEIRYD